MTRLSPEDADEYALSGYCICVVVPGTSVTGKPSRDSPRVTIVDPDECRTSKLVTSKLVSLSQTCRQTYAESALMLFRLNEFSGDYFAGSYGCGDICKDYFADDQRNAIRTMYINTCHPECLQEIDVPSSKFIGLQRVIVEADIWKPDQELYNWVKELVVKVLGRDVDVTLEWLESSVDC